MFKHHVLNISHAKCSKRNHKIMPEVYHIHYRAEESSVDIGSQLCNLNSYIQVTRTQIGRILTTMSEERRMVTNLKIGDKYNIYLPG